MERASPGRYDRTWIWLPRSLTKYSWFCHSKVRREWASCQRKTARLEQLQVSTTSVSERDSKDTTSSCLTWEHGSGEQSPKIAIFFVLLVNWQSEKRITPVQYQYIHIYKGTYLREIAESHELAKWIPPDLTLCCACALQHKLPQGWQHLGEEQTNHWRNEVQGPAQIRCCHAHQLPSSSIPTYFFHRYFRDCTHLYSFLIFLGHYGCNGYCSRCLCRFVEDPWRCPTSRLSLTNVEVRKWR